MNLEQRCTPWPDPSTLRRSAALRNRLGQLPDEASGISLAPLKDVALPPWVDTPTEELTGHIIRQEEATVNDAVLAEELRQFQPADASDPDADRKTGRALAAARVLCGIGRPAEAVERLLAVSQATRADVGLTFFRFWLLEVAEKWLDGIDKDALRGQLLGELGVLVAQAGEIRDGIFLLDTAADLLRQPGAGTGPAGRGPYFLHYLSAEWKLQAFRERPLGIRELRGIQEEGHAWPDREAWLHACFELVAAETGPRRDGPDAVKIRRLLEEVDRPGLPDDARSRLRAHAHQALGRVLAFGQSRELKAEAREAYAEAIRLFEGARDWSNVAKCRDTLGRVCARLGQHDEATDAFNESIKLKQHLKDLWGLGASFCGRAESLLRRGLPLKALDFYGANLALLEKGMARAPVNLVLQNLGLQATAYLAPYQNPFDDRFGKPNPDHVEAARLILDHCAGQLAEHPDQPVAAAYQQMNDGALHGVEARLLPAADPGRIARLLAGEKLLQQSIEQFRAKAWTEPLCNAALYLAGLLIQHATLLPAEAGDRSLLLDAARERLDEADRYLWDTYERAYLDLHWAWYFETRQEKSKSSSHLASARYHAQFCGNDSIAVGIGHRLGVHLRGPTGEESCELLLPPDSTLALEFRATDWQGRPLARYTLRPTLETGYGYTKLSLKVRPEVEAQTDYLGRVTFHVSAPAQPANGRVLLRVEDHDVIRESRVTLHVRPFAILYDARLKARLSEDDQVVLRQLFGPRFCGVTVIKRFGGGKGGATVLLVEPHLELAEAAGPGGAGSVSELRGQRCIVKIGDRTRLVDEAARYERYVQDVLPPNVSQFAGKAVVWHDRAGIRMSLAGGQDWGQAQDETDWLLSAQSLAAHHLLEFVLAGDLGKCWYTNGPASLGVGHLVRAYAPQMPPLLTLRSVGPDDGLLADPPAGLPWTRIEVGLQPPDERGVQPGTYVYLGRLRITAWNKAPDESGSWEYELLDPKNGLRVTYRTPIPPGHVDPDGVAENLIGQSWHVVGEVAELAHDWLSDNLRACAEEYTRTHPGEAVSVAHDCRTLVIETAKGPCRLPNPLRHLHELLPVPLRCRYSLIHGDLHTRNIIVGSLGLPYYIDFGRTGPGPTLFDFLKHEVYLWLWNYGSWPNGPAPAECSLGNALALLEVLTDRANRFPSPFAAPGWLGGSDWLVRLYQCLCTVRSLAQQHVLSPQAQDYFAPLCLYAGLVLRWCDLRRAKTDEERTTIAREGLFPVVLSAMLLARGMVDGVSAAGEEA